MNKPPDETLKQGRNRSWLLVKFALFHLKGTIKEAARLVLQLDEAQITPFGFDQV